MPSGEEEEEENNKNKKKFWEGVVRDTALANIARKVAEHFMSVEVPSQCPLVLLLKLHWKQRVAVGSEEGEGLESGVFGVCNTGKQLTFNVLYLNFGVSVEISALRQEFYVLTVQGCSRTEFLW